MKVRLFIGSSVENLDWSRAIQNELHPHDADVQIWYQGVFGPMQSSMDALLSTLDSSDFGVFICAPDDVTNKRGKKGQSVRDNVLFELGLYIGRLGKGRSFILVPDDAPSDFLPTDLAGLAPLKYELTSGPVQRAVAKACDAVRQVIKKLGPKDAEPVHGKTLGQLALAYKDLTNFADSARLMNLGDAERLAQAYRIAHGHAQSIADNEWPEQDVVVSLKVPASRTLLTCLYLMDRIAPRRLESLGAIPKTIPIVGSVAGTAFNSGATIYVEAFGVGKIRVGRNGHQIKFDKRLVQELAGAIGSVVAVPVKRGETTVAVAKIDSRAPGLFREGDLRTSAIVSAIVACFEMAYATAFGIPTSKPNKAAVGTTRASRSR